MLANTFRSMILLVLLFNSTLTWAKKYALVFAGGSNGTRSDGTPTHHDLILNAYKTVYGLAKSGETETQLFFSETQGQGQFIETPKVKELTTFGVNQQKAEKSVFLSSIRALAAKVGPGDSVFLSILAHGGNIKNGWSFTAAKPGEGFQADPITAAEFTEALMELKRTGAKVGVDINSCHSGEFPVEMLERLRRDESSEGQNQKGVCIRTSSTKGANSEICMESDFDSTGKFHSPHNRSYTSTGDFTATWIYRKVKGAPSNPFQSVGSRCGDYQDNHFDACLKRAERQGLRLSDTSTLKEVARVGRLCDETINFPDSTGIQGDLGGVLNQLANTAQLYVYGHSVDSRKHKGQLNPYSAKDISQRGSFAERAIAELDMSKLSEYERSLYNAVKEKLQLYRHNLLDQMATIKKYNDILGTPLDRDTLRSLLGEKGIQLVNQHLKGEHERKYATIKEPPHSPEGNIPLQSELNKQIQTPPPSKSSNVDEEDGTTSVRVELGEIPAEPTFDTVTKIRLIYVLQSLLANPSTAAGSKEILQQAIHELNGKEKGKELLGEIISLQEKQHQLFLDLIRKEREVYDRLLAQKEDSCDNFRL